MAPPTTSQELLGVLETSQLLNPDEIQETLREVAVNGMPEDPRVLAERFIQAGKITQFHADKLLAGRTRGFILGNGSYRVLEPLGSGAMGHVFLAEHRGMGRKVAIKVLSRTKSNDPSVIKRFEREARAIAALNHPNIVTAFDFGQDGSNRYIVMEYVNGMSVQASVEDYGPFAWQAGCEYVRQAASALKHADDLAGLVHRDIKPGNLLVDRDGLIKLLDMGLAVLTEEKDDNPLTVMYNQTVGTADYVAPEQAIDSHNVDIRADIYSLGATFYFMLTGKVVFDEPTVAMKLIAHQTKPPKSVREFNPEIPEAVDAIMQKMLAKKPDDRYRDPAELMEVMEPFAQRMAPPFVPADEWADRERKFQSRQQESAGQVTTANAPRADFGASPGGPGANGVPDTPETQLTEITESWTDLSPEIRQAIVLLVRATAPKS